MPHLKTSYFFWNKRSYRRGPAKIHFEGTNPSLRSRRFTWNPLEFQRLQSSTIKLNFATESSMTVLNQGFPEIRINFQPLSTEWVQPVKWCSYCSHTLSSIPALSRHFNFYMSSKLPSKVHLAIFESYGMLPMLYSRIFYPPPLLPVMGSDQCLNRISWLAGWKPHYFNTSNS